MRLLTPNQGQALNVAALRSGEWRIEQVVLDDMPRLRLTARGYLVGAGYFSTPAGVAEALERYGGPDLAAFEPEDECE